MSNNQRKKEEHRCWQSVLTHEEYGRLLYGDVSTERPFSVQAMAERHVLRRAALERVAEATALRFQVPCLYLQLLHIHLLPLPWFHGRVPIPHLPDQIPNNRGHTITQQPTILTNVPSNTYNQNQIFAQSFCICLNLHYKAQFLTKFHKIISCNRIYTTKFKCTNLA